MNKLRNVFTGVFIFGLLGLNISLIARGTEEWTKNLVSFNIRDAVGVLDIWNAGRTEQYLSNNGYAVIVPYNYNSDGWDADCLNFDYLFPEISEYNRIQNPYEDDNLRGIQYYGQGSANRTLIDKYGLSDDVASYGRKIATWQWAKDNGVPGNDGQSGFTGLHGNGSLADDESDRLIAFIHELRQQVVTNTPTNFVIDFDGEITRKDPQVTSEMSISEYFPYTVAVSSPGHVTDVAGNEKHEFAPGEKFVVQVAGNFIGEINISAKTEQIFYNMVYLQATVNGNQNLLTNELSDPMEIVGDVSLTFKGAYDIIDITKRTQDEKLLANTVYEVADNLQFEHAQKFMTDAQGHIHLEELLLAEATLYIREYSAPVLNEHLGYNIMTGVTEVKGVGGETHVLQFENDKIMGKICINKTDEQGQALHNVQFDLLTFDGRLLDTKTTDPQGKLCFDNLELGQYKIIERVPDDYTADKLVYDIDVKLDDDMVSLGYNTQSDYVVTVLLDVVNAKIVRYNPNVQTVATGINGEKTFKPNSNIEFIDYVEYTDLAPNQEYMITGIIMNKETGAPLLIDGSEVRGTEVFIPTKPNGLVEVYFNFNTAGLEGKDLVVFESITQNDIEIVGHSDINDVGQTIHIKEKSLVSTGQYVIEIVLFGISLIGISILGLFKLKTFKTLKKE